MIVEFINLYFKESISYGKNDWVELPPQGLNVLHPCAGVSCAP